MKKDLQLEAVSPVFNFGAIEELPEIRPASIRGQLHQWFRLLGGDFERERAIFGGISLKTGKKRYEDHASRVIVRVSALEGKTGHEPTLPHKQGGKAAPKACYLPGTRFRLHILDRLGGLNDRQERFLERTLRAWLLLGGFGTRATRGGGSLQAVDPPLAPTPEEWTEQVGEVLENAPVFAALLPKSYANERDARTVITDTIGGPFDEARAASPLAQTRFPLGVVRDRKINTNAPSRKTSPLKLRIYRFGDGSFRIVAVWDARQRVTGNREDDLKRIATLLEKSNKPLGPELRNVLA